MKTFNPGIIPCFLLCLMLAGSISNAQAQAKATFTFGNTPFDGTTATGGKQSFKSNELIYMHIDFPVPIEEYFSMATTSSDVYYPVNTLQYTVNIYDKNGESLGRNSWPYFRISKEQRKAKYLNLDVQPHADQATTVISSTPEFSAGKECAPLYSMYDRERFPNNGDYKIEIRIQCWAFDPYSPGTVLSASEWPTAKGEFKYTFNTADLPTLKAAYAKAGEMAAENARKKAMKERGLPKDWNAPRAPIALGLTDKQLEDLMLAKEDAGAKILKTVVLAKPGAGWVIVKNDSGLPLWRWHSQPIKYFVQKSTGCLFVDGDLRSQYTGGGNYGPTYYQWTDAVEIDCNVIPKGTGK